jgi:hypothetical protein
LICNTGWFKNQLRGKDRQWWPYARGSSFQLTWLWVFSQVSDWEWINLVWEIERRDEFVVKCSKSSLNRRIGFLVAECISDLFFRCLLSRLLRAHGELVGQFGIVAIWEKQFTFGLLGRVSRSPIRSSRKLFSFGTTRTWNSLLRVENVIERAKATKSRDQNGPTEKRLLSLIIA